MIYPLTIMPGDWAALNTSLDYLQQRSVSDWPGTFPDSALAYTQRAANLVHAGPASGNPAVPTWRALVAADIPSLDASKITTGKLALARGGTNADLSATGGANQIVKQTAAGAALTVATLGVGDVPDVALSSNVALKNAANTFSLGQTIASSGAMLTGSGAATASQYVTLVNTGGNTAFGIENSVGGGLYIGSSSYATTIGSENATPFQIGTNGTIRASFDSTGLLTLKQSISSYNGITTAGQGVGVVVANLALTGQNANIAATNLLAAAPAGFYEAKIYPIITTVGTGTLSVTVTGNDGTAATSLIVTEVSTGLGNSGYGNFPFRSGAAQNVTYAVSGTAGGVVYALYIVLVRYA